jgi:hypothetical protein
MKTFWAIIDNLVVAVIALLWVWALMVFIEGIVG